MSAPDGRARSPVDRPWQLIEVVGDASAIAAQWDELADRVSAEPYARPGWIAAWWDAFGEEGRFGVVALRSGERVSAVAPLVRRAGMTESPSNDHTPRFAPLAEDQAAARELADVLMRLRQRRLSLGPLDPEDRVTAAVREAATDAGYRVLELGCLRSPYLPLEGVERADAVVDRKMRKELRRCRRRLEDMGEVVVGVEPRDADLDALLDEAFAVEALGWKGETGSAIAASPETRRFYTGVARWAAARGTLRLVTARVDGRMVAFELDLLESGRMHALKTGFDPEFGRLSPGHLVALAAVEHAIESGAASYELLGDDEPYKMKWTDRTRELVTLEASAPGARGLTDHLRLRYGRRGARAIGRRAGSIRRRIRRSS